MAENGLEMCKSRLTSLERVTWRNFHLGKSLIDVTAARHKFLRCVRRAVEKCSSLKGRVIITVIIVIIVMVFLILIL